MVTKECSRFAQRDNLGVRSRIGVSDVSVISPADDFAVENDHGTNGDFSDFERALGAAKRFVHPQFVGDRCQMLAGVLHWAD